MQFSLLVLVSLGSCSQKHYPDDFYRAVVEGDMTWLRRNIVHSRWSRGYDKGKTAIHLAVENNQPDVVVFLISHGLYWPIFAGDVDMNTPLHLAASLGRDDMIKVLVKAGAPTETKNWKGWTPLMEAVMQKQSVSAKNLIELGARIDATDPMGRTLLHLAARVDLTEIVEPLIEKERININAVDSFGKTALHYAILSGSARVAEMLLKAHADPNITDGFRNTPLLLAIQTDNIAMARLLLQSGAKVETKGCSALSLASLCGDYRMVQLLLQNGANVSFQEEGGDTPLCDAAGSNNTEVVRLLIENHANINIKNNKESTPLNAACFSGSFDSINLLLEHGAKVNEKDIYGCSPFFIIATSSLPFEERIEVMKSLLAHGALVNDVLGGTNVLPDTGITPLMVAATEGKTDMVKFLLSHGADVNARNSLGATAMHRVANAEIAKMLLEHHAEVNVRSKSGDTPLHMSAKLGNLEVAKVLIENRADPTIKNNDGLTPAEVAKKENHPDVANFIETHSKH